MGFSLRKTNHLWVPPFMEALSSHPTPPWFRPGLAPGTLALGLDIRLGSRKNRGRTTGVTAIKKNGMMEL